MAAYVQKLILRRSKTSKEPEMAEKLDDLSVPMKPVRPPVPTSIPARITELPRSSTSPQESESGSGPSPIRPDMEQARRRTMIVGREVRLSGDIKSCNRLVVEGLVEATLHDCHDMEIAESGFFRGNASSEQAEIRGRFEGELVVSKRLLIRASGHVSGTISYGEIEIERGGKVLGTVQETGIIQDRRMVRAGE
jgi:cytoskeletal protein CcmA (bactofilin family)